MLAGPVPQPPLEGECVPVVDAAEPADPEGLSRGGGLDRGGGQRTSASQSRVSMISLTRCMNAAA